MSCSNCSLQTKIYNNTGGDKLDSYDWLNDIPDTSYESNLVEVRFKNTRKEFFINTNNLKLKRGDYVTVAADKGHDVGQVSLTGRLAELQLKRKKVNQSQRSHKKIYRLSKESELNTLREVRQKETVTMIRAREISKDFGLEMFISDVEYQGDASKAIFYYIAEGRVDFRELIKQYAKVFNIRIEIRQIGARQEAARIGGIGSCGRELCCSTWRTDFSSITMNMARKQQLPENTQRLMGNCGKLKCCLTYELDNYLDAWEDFPEELLELETKKGIAYRHKVDVLKKEVFYSYNKNFPEKLVAVSLSRVKEIINLNKRGEKPNNLLIEEVPEIDFKHKLEDETPLKKRFKPKKKRYYKKNVRSNSNNNR